VGARGSLPATTSDRLAFSGLRRLSGRTPGAPTKGQPSFVAPSIEEKMVINTLNKKVSKPRQTSPEQSQKVESVENQSTSTQGIIGQTVESTGDVEQPLGSATVDVIIDLK